MTPTIVLDDLTREVPAVRDLVDATQSDHVPANSFWNNWASFGRSAAPRVVTAA